MTAKPTISVRINLEAKHLTALLKLEDSIRKSVSDLREVPVNKPDYEGQVAMECDERVSDALEDVADELRLVIADVLGRRSA